MKTTKPNLTRRRCLQTLALGGWSLQAGSAGVLLESLSSSASAQSKPLAGKTMILLTYGGSYQDAVKKIMAQPFTEATGANVVIDGSCCEKLDPALATGRYVADVVLGLDETSCKNYEVRDWTTDLPGLKSIEIAAGIDAAATSSRYAPLNVYAYVAATADKSAPLPHSWADFWNVDKYPGSRGLIRAEPIPILEIALLADGVSPASLYPLDVDRAFASLDKLRKKTRVYFAATGAEQINLLATGETKYSVVYSNRVVLANDSGLGIRATFASGMLMRNCAIIPKAAKNPDVALEFIKFYLQPDRLARFAERTGLAPITPEGAARIAPNWQAVMPSTAANQAQMIPVNSDYWSKQRTAIYDRWITWLAQ